VRLRSHGGMSRGMGVEVEVEVDGVDVGEEVVAAVEAEEEGEEEVEVNDNWLGLAPLVKHRCPIFMHIHLHENHLLRLLTTPTLLNDLRLDKDLATLP
jgi:hypothetical protein